MITFKTTADLAKLRHDDPARAVIQECRDLLLDTFPTFDPDMHGYVVLIEPGDTTIDLPELRGTVADLSWDGVWKQDCHYHAVYLTNNEFAIEFIIPASIDGAIRASLEAQMSPSYSKEHHY